MADPTEVPIRSRRTGEQRSIAATAVPFFVNQPDGEYELVVDDLPPLNASTEVWQEYATGHGMTEEQAAELNRTQLIQHFAPTRGDEDTNTNDAPEG